MCRNRIDWFHTLFCFRPSLSLYYRQPQQPACTQARAGGRRQPSPPPPQEQQRALRASLKKAASGILREGSAAASSHTVPRVRRRCSGATPAQRLAWPSGGIWEGGGGTAQVYEGAPLRLAAAAPPVLAAGGGGEDEGGGATEARAFPS